MLETVSRITGLEESLKKLRSELDDHDLDWADMRARCKRLLDRTEKAARRVDNAEAGAENPEVKAAKNGEGALTQTQSGHLLTPRQAAIQQQILRRRSNL